jgi:hypothetical protein
MTEFRDLVDTEGLSAQEEARLRRVHELLVQAGPPAELPPGLAAPTGPPPAEILQFPLMPRRRWAAAFVVAATLVAFAFGGGYLFGHSKAKPEAFSIRRVVTMKPQTAGTPGLAVLKVASPDAVGNWPMEMSVTNLPPQSEPAAYYELWLSKNGKPVAPCGTFRVHGKTTNVRFSVSYQLTRFDGWVVTVHRPGLAEPGPVVLST